MKIGDIEIICDGSFEMSNLPDDFILGPQVSFVGEHDLEIPILKKGDELKFYTEGSEHFDVVIGRVDESEPGEISFTASSVEYVSHNEAEIAKLGRGRIF